MTPKEHSLESYRAQIGITELGDKHLDRFNRIYDLGHADGVKQGLDTVRSNLGITVDSEVLVAVPGYEKLVDVLRMAHDHAAKGKGLERHANELPFEQQRMLSITRQLKSPRGLAYQVIKKITEGLDLPTHKQQIAELLGAINYAAGIVIYLNEQEAAKPVPAEQATDTAAPAPEPKNAYEELAEAFAGTEYHSLFGTTSRERAERLGLSDLAGLLSGKCVCGYCDDAESSKVLTDHGKLSTHEIEQLDQRRLQFREKRKGQHIDEGWLTTSFMHWAIMRDSPYADVRILSADQLREDDARPKNAVEPISVQIISTEGATFSDLAKRLAEMLHDRKPKPADK